MFVKRILATLGVVVIASTVLTGCGQTISEEAPTSVEEVVEETPAVQEPVEPTVEETAEKLGEGLEVEYQDEELMPATDELLQAVEDSQ